MTAEILLSSPGLVHPVLTTDQAEMVHQALIAFLNAPEGSFSEHEVEEQAVRAALSELVFFFSNVVDHPEAFGVRSAQETKRLIRTAKPVAGPAQQKSKRKRRQRTRMGHEKRTRREKREEAEDYNRAAKIMADEQAEAEQIRNDEMIAKIDRSNELLKRDSLSAEELQELLEIMGYGNVAEAARIMRREDSPEARIAAAQAKAEADHGSMAEE